MTIYLTDPFSFLVDRQEFLKTLAEACQKTHRNPFLWVDPFPGLAL
jgi:hypothetical protein